MAYFDRHGVRRHAETDHTFMVTLVLTGAPSEGALATALAASQGE